MKKIWFRACSFTLLLAVLCIYVSAQDVPGKRKADDLATASSVRLIDLVVESDPLLLKSNDEEQIARYLKDKNNRIMDYLVARYPQYGVPDVDVHDPAATWFGLVVAMYEGVQFKPLKDLKLKSLLSPDVPAWLSCAVSVMGAAYGVDELIGSLGSFSYGSVWKVVKFVVKKYVTGWLGTAIALYSIANECF